MRRIELPDKPSELARVAYEGLMHCREDHRYRFCLYEHWLHHHRDLNEAYKRLEEFLKLHRRMSDGFPCQYYQLEHYIKVDVTLAGCVVKLKTKCGVRDCVSYQDFDQETQLKLRVIDGLGRGVLVEPFDFCTLLNRDDSFVKFSPHTTPRFATCLSQFADDLKAGGL